MNALTPTSAQTHSDIHTNASQNITQPSAPPEEGTTLEGLIEKATNLSQKTLQAQQMYFKLANSYYYYDSLPGQWRFEEDNARTTLGAADLLEQQHSNFEKEHLDLVKEFAHFDSFHHITYSANNPQTAIFKDLLTEIVNHQKFYKKDLPVLKSKLLNVVKSFVANEPNEVAPKKNPDCCAIL